MIRRYGTREGAGAEVFRVKLFYCSIRVFSYILLDEWINISFNSPPSLPHLLLLHATHQEIQICRQQPWFYPNLTAQRAIGKGFWNMAPQAHPHHPPSSAPRGELRFLNEATIRSEICRLEIYTTMTCTFRPRDGSSCRDVQYATEPHLERGTGY